jgi:hypothetical protein
VKLHEVEIVDRGEPGAPVFDGWTAARSGEVPEEWREAMRRGVPVRVTFEHQGKRFKGSAYPIQISESLTEPGVFDYMTLRGIRAAELPDA